MRTTLWARRFRSAARPGNLGPRRAQAVALPAALAVAVVLGACAQAGASPAAGRPRRAATPGASYVAPLVELAAMSNVMFGPTLGCSGRAPSYKLQVPEMPARCSHAALGSWLHSLTLHDGHAAAELIGAPRGGRSLARMRGLLLDAAGRYRSVLHDWDIGLRRLHSGFAALDDPDFGGYPFLATTEDGPAVADVVRAAKDLVRTALSARARSDLDCYSAVIGRSGSFNGFRYLRCTEAANGDT